MTNPDRTLEAILSAAMKLFAETGAEQLSVSDLAQAAGLSRGTRENNLDNPGIRFDDLTSGLALDFESQLRQSFEEIEHPADRIAFTLKTVIRCAHREPIWADFIKRYTLIDIHFQRFWSNLPSGELRRGRELGVFDFELNQISSATSVMGGSALIGTLYVRRGVKGWRESGAEISELVLRSVGMSKEVAGKHARIKLPESADRNFSLDRMTQGYKRSRGS